jgi:hypothetical protein
VSALWLLLVACGGADGPAPVDPTAEPPVDTGSSAGTDPTATTGDSGPVVPACPAFGEPLTVGVVTDETLVENSGLAWADGLLWGHNDSGEALLYGMSPQGAVLRRVPVRGMSVYDWEDLALRDGSLWLADVGDNLAVRSEVTLYEVEVPGEGAAEVVARPVTVQWPDGPRDCETLLADPVSGDLLLMSKELDGDVRVARVVDPAAEASALEEVARVRFGPEGWGAGTFVTGGDVSADGRYVVIRAYLEAMVFPRVPGEPWAETFAREPCEVDVVGESQGEAVAWGPDGLYFVSEGSQPRVNLTPLPGASR